ncbi:sulfotransferase domain-containing protein [Brevundimonas diminuta]|uniref:sulfotransferase domain-containing protein n=1 Tax=Brevundimonas diminuta TaxID=293 RepID=UPI003D086E50
MAYVQFLIAGVQKCGTSALDAYLRQHPEIEMAAPKETHFFDRESGVNWRSPDYDLLHGHYRHDERLHGEATPVTLYWTPAHYRVLTYNPDMKFILLFRDPAERAWSHWKMIRSRGQDSLPFSRAVREGRMRALDQDGPMGLSRLHSYVERGFYARQIEELSKLFAHRQMLFLDQGELDTRPDNALAKVTDFLGVSRMAPVTPERVNVSAADHEEAFSTEDRLYLKELYRTDQDRFERMTGLRLG